jgi:hypothetical protein
VEEPQVSLNRYAVRRDENEKPIVSALRLVGAEVELMSKPCDLLVRFRFQFFPMEVDNPQSKYRKRSPKQLETLKRMGIPLVRTADEALRIIGAM